MKDAIFIYGDDELQYRFNDTHPFNPQRLKLTVDLLHSVGALNDDVIKAPRIANQDELLLAHNLDYIEAVQALSQLNPEEPWLHKAKKFGLADEDNPFFPNMHDISSLVVGGSLLAADLVMSGKYKRALHLGGGLHHAQPAKGSGFCIYNDATVAIAYIKKHYKARVLYIDTDAHHGDGVQWSFYSDPDVCTYSIHETGKYLYPGTGEVNERGDGDAFGTCFNIPLEPYTEDDSWLESFQSSIERVIAHFKPDIIVSQHGVDAHAYDPQTHIHCSMDIYLQIPLIIQQLADQWCNGRWIALGGGGYDVWRVVPRAWSLLWLVMSDHELVKHLQKKLLLPLPPHWIQEWAPRSPMELPNTWLDDKQLWSPIPRRAIIEEANRHRTQVSTQFLPPL